MMDRFEGSPIRRERIGGARSAARRTEGRIPESNPAPPPLFPESSLNAFVAAISCKLKAIFELLAQPDPLEEQGRQ
jgi:hypothetical protein